MSALAIRPHRVGQHEGRRLAMALAVAALVVGGALVVTDRLATDDGSTTTVTSAVTPPAASTTTDAIDGWLAANRDDVFTGAEGPYAGTCPTTTPATQLIGLCSSLREDLGDVQLHTVGVWASDWGADLLLVRDDAGSWAVEGASPWPQLGTRYDGSPWSPLTAITTWWFDRAPARYGAGAVHLQSCSDALAVTGADVTTAQPLLCSTLVEADGATRTYDSGLAGQPPDVRFVLTERSDHTWAVTDTTAAG